MKKVLVLLSIVGVAQGLLAEKIQYQYLNKYFKNSNITQKCLENSQSWLPTRFVTYACDCLDKDLNFVQEGLEHGFRTIKTIDEDMLRRATKKLSEELKDRHAKQMMSMVAIYKQQDIVKNVALLEQYVNSPELLKQDIAKDAELFKEYNAYQNALEEANKQALLNALERIKK